MSQREEIERGALSECRRLLGLSQYALDDESGVMWAEVHTDQENGHTLIQEIMIPYDEYPFITAWIRAEQTPK